MAEVVQQEDGALVAMAGFGDDTEVVEVTKGSKCPKEKPYLSILNLAADVGVEFRQIKITGFSDTVTPSWNEEIVYGRMDPIATYQGTTRAIELSFDLGPFSESDDRKKLALMKISRLMQMQYPTYSWVSSAMSISQPPLLEISFHNYIRDQLCYLTEVSYNPDDGMDALTTPQFNGEDILPQRLSVSLSLKVLHATPPGWQNDAWSGAPVGPLEVDTEFSTEPDTATGTAAFANNGEDIPRNQAMAESDPFSFADTSRAGDRNDLHLDTPGTNLFGPGSGMED